MDSNNILIWINFVSYSFEILSQRLGKSIEFHSPHRGTRAQSISHPNSQTLIVSDTTGATNNYNFPPRPRDKLPPVNTIPAEDSINLQDVVE